MAEVPCLVALVVAAEAQRVARLAGERQLVHDLRHQRVEERLLRHALQVHEHGEELPVARLVLRQHALEVVQERGLADPPLAGDHQAVAVQGAQHALRQLLPPEEHLVVQHGRAGDVGIEAQLHRAPPADALRAPADPDQRDRAEQSRGQEVRALVEAQPPLEGERDRAGGEARGVERRHADRVLPRLERQLLHELPAADGLGGRGREGDLGRDARADPELDPLQAAVVRGDALQRDGGGLDPGIGLEDVQRGLLVRQPALEELLAGPQRRHGQSLARDRVAGIQAQRRLEAHLRVGEAALLHQRFAARHQGVDLGPQLLLLAHAVEDLEVPGEQRPGLDVLRVDRGVGQRRERLLVRAGVEQLLAARPRLAPLLAGGGGEDLRLRGGAALERARVARIDVERLAEREVGVGRPAVVQQPLAVREPLLEPLAARRGVGRSFCSLRSRSYSAPTARSRSASSPFASCSACFSSASASS